MFAHVVQRVFLSVGLVLVLAPAAEADYEAGNRAWDEMRPAEAVEQWQAAADDGDWRAMLALGRLYATGLGVLQDYILAHMWFNLAASRGEVEALEQRDALAAKMTPQQVAEAQERASVWRLSGSPESGSPQAAARASAPSPPTDGGPGRPLVEALREAQELLATLGYSPGAADGIWGRRSVQAYQTFLRDTGLPQAEVLTPEGLSAMRVIATGRDRETELAEDSDRPSTRTTTEPAKAEPTRPTLPRDTLLRLVKAGDIDGVKVALEAGAGVHIDERDGQGWTALMHVANKGYTLLVPSLLDAQPDLDVRAADGATALFITIVRGDEEMAKMLAQAGADTSIAGPRGKTPLDVAQVLELESTVALLESVEADRTAFSAAKRADTAAAYNLYLTSYPDGLFVSEAEQLRDVAQDREAFQKAQATGTAQAYRDYLKIYRAGAYRQDALRLVNELDEAEFNQAVRVNSSAAYAKYIAGNRDGLFVADAERRRREALDHETFEQAKARNTIQALEDYLTAHPDGAYRVQAQNIIRRLRDPILFAETEKTHTIEAYEHYLALYPDGDYADKARYNIAELTVIGQEFSDNCTGCPTMVVIPPGSFIMGSDKGKQREKPSHRITISKPFAVGKYEVTFAEFKAFVQDMNHDMGEKESFFDTTASEPCSSRGVTGVFKKISWQKPGYDQQEKSPAVCINWSDAATYVKWLSERTDKQYRLLTESEWEYAARAQTRANFYFGEMISTSQANYDSSHDDELSTDRGSLGKTTRVGSFPPNEFGLYDMHGNVFEWVEDCWHENYKGAPRDGRAWTWGGNCALRVLRGGSWFNRAPLLRSAFRGASKMTHRYTHYGLRVARTIDPLVLHSEFNFTPPEQ